MVTAALTLLVLGTLGAVQAGMSGASFMYDLEQTRPPLARVEPAYDTAPAPRLARRVVLVIVDGLRFDRSFELPYLDDLRRRGADLELQVPYPTWCRPSYVTLLTGVPPSASGVRTDHHSTAVMLDTLMDRARAAGLRSASASDHDVLPRLFLRRRSAPDSREPIAIDIDDEAELDAIDDPMASSAAATPDIDVASPFDDARFAPWAGGFAESAGGVVDGDAELVVLLLGNVDAAGHEYGADDPAYREAVEAADRVLAGVLAKVDLTRDAILVVGDHGHTARGGHGGVEPEVTSVPLILAGAGIVPGATVGAAGLADVAPTVAALLGMPAPGHGLGRTLLELLSLDDAARAHRHRADELRLTATRAIVGAAEARAAVDVLEHRAGRLFLVLSGAALAIMLAIVLARRDVLHLDVRLLVVTVPAFFVVYYGLIGVAGQRFSPSLLPAQGHFGSQLVRYGLAATCVQLLANLWALHKQPDLKHRLAAANGVAWAGLLMSVTLAGVVWAYFPPPYVAVPSPFWIVTIPAVKVAVACTAVTFALTLAVEVIVFAARAWHRERPAAE
ncbi:MAG TPA: alkaline phosphatase family protein [Kofleriaceae bacterium]|nr:alkaline phosphatase family protein [Kofleriaceae bacterium]